MAETSENTPQGLEQQLALLKALADKPLVLPPVFVDITGSHVAGLLLQQGVYWTKKNLERDPSSDGWFFISLPKLQEQLRMGEHCLRDARSALKEKGFMESKRAGIPPKLFFRVELLKVLEAVNLQLRQNGGIGSVITQKSQNGKITLTKGQINPDKTPETVPPKSQFPNKEQETKGLETKKETTQERNAAPVENQNQKQKQANLDTWDLRRFNEELKRLQGASVGSHGSWESDQRIAAFRAGLSPERHIQLLKKFFPNDPDVDGIYAKPPLFADQPEPKPAESEEDIRQTIERSLDKTITGGAA